MKKLILVAALVLTGCIEKEKKADSSNEVIVDNSQAKEDGFLDENESASYE